MFFGEIMRRARRGSTLLECVIVMAVITVMIGILLPAVQRMRERARRMECLHRMRQLALAVHTFHDSHGHVPGPQLTRTGGGRFRLMLSAWAHLLPQVDQAPAFQSIDHDPLEVGLTAYPGPPSLSRPRNQALLSTSIPIFLCPSDSVPLGGCNFRSCLGTTNTNMVGPTGKPGIWYQRPNRPVGFESTTDGLSQTVLLSERIAGDFDPVVFSPHRDTYFIGVGALPNYPSPDNYRTACANRFGMRLPGDMSYGGATWLLAGKAYTEYNHVLPPNSSVPDCTESHPWMVDSATAARSWHTGGVNVALGDGAVRFVSENIDLELWQALATRNGSESLGDF